GVSLTHGFFFSMGGFVSRDGRQPITTLAQLKAESGYRDSIRGTPRDDIMDKSKGDALSKGVALLQGLWFITQIVARFVQMLPVTQLEVTTLAFAVVNLSTWVLWWHKPLDVLQPILITSGPPLLPRIEPHGNLLDEIPMRPLFRQENDISDATPLVDQPSIPTAHNPNPRSNSTVPTFWSSPDEPEQTAFAGILVGIVFGAIHCAAWNAAYPSSVERILWRVSAVAVAGLPAWLLIPHGFGTLVWSGHTHDHVPIAVQVLGIGLYYIFRGFLIVLPFTALRTVDNGWLIAVDWTVHIPHLSL
ncbi:hypothetical protein B0H12DRAFT_1012227, partial [Mycena haematopus]